MSYCRWSSDDSQCDVYVYEDVSGGWTCHVATQRLDLRGVTLPPPLDYDGDSDTLGERWVARHEAVCKLLDPLREANKWIDFSHNEYAGTTDNTDTPGEMAELLEEIKASGLKVPQHAIDALREEQQELDAA